MNLVIDRGNTRVKIGIYDDRTMVYRDSFKNLSAGRIGRLREAYPKVQRAIVSFTKSYNSEVDEAIRAWVDLIVLDHTTSLPFDNQYLTPETLGRDRLANMAAAAIRYPGSNVLVIDAGTCITFDFLKEGKVYRGGSIHPGLSMRFKALHTFTGNLPLVSREDFTDFEGRNTRESILAGVITAAAVEIEGIIARYRNKYGRLTVVMTGGDYAVFVSRLKSKIFAQPNFALDGLNEILIHNTRND